MPQRSSRARKALSQDDVKRVLYYNAQTGVFTWLVSHQSVKRGDTAGTLIAGYVNISIGGHKYKAHRLAWLYAHGYNPPNQIDHINGIPSDNRLVNLREATHGQNAINSRRPLRNTSGVKGVGWYKPCQKWRARIRFCGTLFHLGLFQRKEDAAAAYSKTAEKLHGEFRRVS